MFSVYRRISRPSLTEESIWLPRMDSNHDNKIQNLVSYH